LLTRLKERKLADDYFMYVEDIQWCLDFHKLGLDIAFLPEVKVIHHMAASSGIKSTWMKENMDLFMTRNYSVLHRNCIRVLDKLLAQ
jgi:GT2 family glycosyltransferase